MSKENRIFLRDVYFTETGKKPESPNDFDIYQKKIENGYVIYVAFNGKFTKIGTSEPPISINTLSTQDEFYGYY